MKNSIECLISLVFYLAIGLAVYMLMYAPAVFSWTNPWLFVVIVLWPFALAWEVLWWIVAFVVIVAIIALFIILGD